MVNEQKKQLRADLEKTMISIASEFADDTAQKKPIETERDMAIILACCSLTRAEAPEPTDEATIPNERARKFLLEIRNIAGTVDQDKKLQLLRLAENMVIEFELPELERAIEKEIEGAEALPPSPLAEEEGRVREELPGDVAEHQLRDNAENLSLEGKAGVSLPMCGAPTGTGPCVLSKGHGDDDDDSDWFHKSAADLEGEGEKDND